MLPKCCQTLPDLPPITDARYAEARKRFKTSTIKMIRQVLNPPEGFDLEGRLWRAVAIY
jgi:hypothetical protein